MSSEFIDMRPVARYDIDVETPSSMPPMPRDIAPPPAPPKRHPAPHILHAWLPTPADIRYAQRLPMYNSQPPAKARHEHDESEERRGSPSWRVLLCYVPVFLRKGARPELRARVHAPSVKARRFEMILANERQRSRHAKASWRYRAPGTSYTPTPRSICRSSCRPVRWHISPAAAIPRSSSPCRFRATTRHIQVIP